jgi:Na+-translocating ferredoxin:NAD+ oxidoreductase RnfC subunit
MKEARRVPLTMLRRKLKVEEYEGPAAFRNTAIEPARVRIKLLQHAGKAARPVVARGDKVEKGAVVGRVDAAELGANIHASIAGTVDAVTEAFIEVKR